MLGKVAVLGAAGKMGSGISFLLLQEMLKENADNSLILIDVSEKSLNHLKQYLEKQIRKKGVEEETEIKQILKSIHFSTDVLDASSADLIFEAIVEDKQVKAGVFSKIDSNSKNKPLYFTNTSSIPISVLSKKSQLNGRLIGFHFYNPPALQTLLELIPSLETKKELTTLAEDIAKRLGKDVIFSNDVAGFIGNGHFMREIDYTCKKVKELEPHYGKITAIWIMNSITQELLIRPMGIFQLLDYVGLDVCQKVMNIMQTYLNESFDLKLIEGFISKGLIGGQNPDGSLKEGIFRYDGSVITHIFDGNKYVNLPEISLKPYPKGHQSWKQLHKEKEKESILKEYFKNLFSLQTPFCLLAQKQLLQSRKIAKNLVKDGVAFSIDDVNTVLKKGFYHLYGADCPYY